MVENINLVEIIRKTELLKSEIICQTGALYKSMLEENSTCGISNILANLIIDIYQLGDIIGVSPFDLEQSITERLSSEHNISQAVVNSFLKARKTGKGF